MILGIIVQGSSITLLFLSLLEFIFMMPVVFWIWKRKVPFRGFLKSVLWKSGQGKKNAFLSLASVGISFGMLILGSMLIRLQEIVFSAVFGEAALQQARDNLNQFVIVQPSFMDVVIFGATSFLVIALNEELFFRAFLLRVAGPSRVGGSLISASLFAAYHLVTSMSVYSIVFMVPYYFSWGLVLSAEYLASGEQLVFPILTHGSFNLLLLML